MHVISKSRLLVVIAVILINGCEQVLEPDSLISVSDAWQQHPNNPIIKMGDLRKHSNWNDPSVLNEGREYVMYMTTTRGKPFETPVLPFRAVSKDGLNWTLSPKKALLSNEGTDYAKIETPSVVKFRGKYHMFFTGVYEEGSLPAMSIGHATSLDGKKWTLSNRGEPVLQATGNLADWNGYAVAEPGAIVYQDKIYVYYGATGGRPSGNPPQLQVIALAITTDGVNYSQPLSVLRQCPLQYPPEKGYCGYSTPAALVIDGNIHLFYAVAQFRKHANPDWAQVALHHAKSMNGGTQFVQDDLAVMRRGQHAWLETEVRSPSLLLEGDTLKMWYAGHGEMSRVMHDMLKVGKGNLFGIGYATIEKSQLFTQ